MIRIKKLIIYIENIYTKKIETSNPFNKVIIN